MRVHARKAEESRTGMTVPCSSLQSVLWSEKLYLYIYKAISRWLRECLESTHWCQDEMVWDVHHYTPPSPGTNRGQGSIVSVCPGQRLLRRPWCQLYSRCILTSGEQKGGITSLSPLAIHCLMQPRIPFAFFTVKAHCWLVFSLVPTRTIRSFSDKLLSSWVAPACTGAWDCFSTDAGLCASPY